MGGRRLRPISFGNGQNRNKGSSFHELQREQTAKARNKQTSHSLFSMCDEALTSITFAELQAQNCTSHLFLCRCIHVNVVRLN